MNAQHQSPEEWRKVKIQSICHKVTSHNPRQNRSGQFVYIDISSVNNEEKRVNDPKIISNSEAPSRARQLVQNDDVIVSTVRPNLNAVALIPQALHNAICSTGFCVLRPNQSLVDPEYLFSWVKHPEFIQRLSRKARGISYPAVSGLDVFKLHISLPTLPEQREIVRVLRQADELRQLRDSADQKIEALLPSIFTNLFGTPE